MLIEPFRGILYNKKKIGDFAKVCAPPYDIISAAEQDEYYKKSPYNVIRLELNRSRDPYRSAARFLNDWRKEGVLNQDEKPSIYIYGQDFKYKNRIRHTLGFIAAAKIEQSRHSKVRPHEMTFKAPKEDREKVLEAVGANISCIYTLFDVGARCSVPLHLTKASRKKPFIDVRFDSVRHRLWKIDDSKWIKKLQRLMKDKQAFIADGHHRYEAAANFRDKNNTYPANYIMMYFAGMEDKNLTILATHRVVKDFDAPIFDGLSGHFDVTPVPSKQKMLDILDRYFGKAHVFGMYADRKFSVLKLKNHSVGARSSVPLLDVAILHSLILNGVQDIFYTRDTSEAIELVNKKQYKTAFFLNPTHVRQIKDTSLKGEKMPHKSTYFYPKLLTGLVMRKFY